MDIPYFRKLYKETLCKLQKLCTEWDVLSTESGVPEKVHDDIRSTIGLTKLLMSEKLAQFAGLIDDSEFKRGEKEITCMDLQGFWDMVYTQVEKLQHGFKKLEDCKNNDWVFIEEKKSKNTLSKKKSEFVTTVVKAQTMANAQSHASAARQRLAEAKRKMKATLSEGSTAAAQEVDIVVSQPQVKLPSVQSPLKDIECVQESLPNTSTRGRPKKKALTTVKDEGMRKKRAVGKENVKSVTKEPEKLNKGSEVETAAVVKIPKPILPLQCVTRSKAKLLPLKR